MKNIVLIGGGLHVQYCIDIIEKQDIFKIIGITDPYKEIGTELLGYKIIGRQEDLVKLIKAYDIYGGLITIGDNWTRKYVYEIIKKIKNDFIFINAIHPSVVIGKNVLLGSGIVTMAGVIINPGARVGDFCFLATGAQLEHDSIMGDFSSLSAGSITGGKVEIGNYTAITLGVTIIDRIKIGEN